MIGRHDPALLAAMTTSLSHRGPDGDGLHVEGPLGLGHRRLAVLDLAGGAQPMTSADGAAIVTFNGEIFNYVALRQELLAAGQVLRTQGDTEVLLAGYQHWGFEDLLARLRGMFAFALYDRRTRELWLARDHLGIKPLYYAELGAALLFGSEPKALLCCAEVDRGLDLEALDAYLDLFYVPPPRSMFAGIRQLPPGHWLRWHAGASTIERWWDPLPRPADVHGDLSRNWGETPLDLRPLRPYNAGADALSVDYGAVRVRLIPTATGVLASSDPLPAGLTLDSRIKHPINGGTGNCGDPLAQLVASKVDTPAGVRLILDGTLPQGCTEPFDWNLAPLPPDRLFEGVFRTLWRELGGEIGGRFRDGRTPPTAHQLAETVSPNLPEVLRDMNKWSNNVIARQVLATLGALAEPGEDSVPAGARQIQRTLAANGIETAGLVVENGAGLSRSERISATTLGQLLLAAWKSRTMPELMSSLPIAGVDGTARRRLPNSPAAGFAHVKTGTLNDVRSLAGYVLARNGHRYAVVLMINHPNADAARDAQDALLEWVAGL